MVQQMNTKNVLVSLLLVNILRGEKKIIKTQKKTYLAKLKESSKTSYDYQAPQCPTRSGVKKSLDIPLDGGNIRIFCTRQGADRHRVKRQVGNMMTPCITIHKVLVGCNGRDPEVPAHKDLVERLCSGKSSCRVNPTTTMFGVHCHGWRRMWITYSCDGGLDMTTSCTAKCPGGKGGKFIQKSEIDLKPDNLIQVLPHLGSEYRITFDLLITRVLSNYWLSVLMFTADKGRPGRIKHGDRIPAVFVYNDRLYIATSIYGNTNHHVNVNATVGKWMKIEIGQTLRDKLTYYIMINGKVVHTTEQNKPCLFRGVKVFATQPIAAVKSVKGKIRNLYYQTSDAVNNGVCVVDFRPKRADPSGVLQGPELDLKSDQLITVVPYIGREYNVSFELYLNKYQTEDWLSVLHFTTSGNSESYGDRNPAVWVGGHRDHHRQLHVSSSIDGTTNMWIKSDKIYPLKTWIKIRISQALMYTQFVYSVVINEETVYTEMNDVPSMFSDVKVYGGDPWYPAQDGKIRNLVLHTKDDSVCVCSRAADCSKK